MWSGMALPSTNSTSFCRHNSRRILPIARRVLPKNSFLRYFGKITTWYLQSHFTWAWLCHSFMTVLLSPSGAFLKEDRLSRTTLERQSLLNSHRQSRWISYDLDCTGQYPRWISTPPECGQNRPMTPIRLKAISHPASAELNPIPSWHGSQAKSARPTWLPTD